jgi:hypothetical protein
MISDENIEQINKSKENKFFLDALPFIILLLSFFISIYFQFKLNDDTALFVDKIIDFSSIFFGVFIGCLYLFDKFKSNNTYNSFLRFCKTSIFLNIILITLSFILIVINPLLSDDEICSYDFLYFIRFGYSIKTILFSLYFSVFATSIYYLIRFLRIIFILLK